jgi:hypothetical protein
MSLLELEIAGQIKMGGLKANAHVEGTAGTSNIL